MLHARDSFNPASQEFTSCSPAPTAYFSISGREWHNTPRIRSPVLTSACIYTQQNHNVFVRYHLFCVKNKKKCSSHKIYSVEWLLRSEVGQATEEKGGSKNKRQVGQYGTEKGAFHHYDLAFRAKSAMMTSVTFPNVAFSRPPTAIDSGTLTTMQVLRAS
jgi:hypothetical protein